MNILPNDGGNHLTCTLNREFEQFFENSLQRDAANMRLELGRCSVILEIKFDFELRKVINLFPLG